MGFTFRLAGRRLVFLLDDVETKSRPLGDADFAGFKDWASRYGAAVRDDRGGRSISLETLLGIGREIAAWLDGAGWMADLSGDEATHLDIAVGDSSAPEARAFLDVPWEVMATEEGFLAADAVRPFCIQRRIGQPPTAAAPPAPRFQSLKLMFMAASPRAVAPVLDYEAEEAAILHATDNLPLALTVEESGCLTFLAQRLAAEGPFEALHLSCHGDIVGGMAKLLLESPEGDRAEASAADIAAAFGSEKPGLVFLAACRTAEHEAQSAPLVMELLRAGVASVLGWDGSVLDTDATQFAQGFYTQLARCQTPAFAAAKARQALLAAHFADPERRTGRHWHMARLYASTNGAAALCDAGAAARPAARGATYNAFLDKARARVPVAGPMAFVGRRRETQVILSALRDRTLPGVLIHAIGGQGKSSLAARVADRLPRHRTAVVFGDYRALPIFDAVLTAVPSEQRDELRKRYRDRIEAEGILPDALEGVLTGPCAAFDAGRDRAPVLLVIDDLEQALIPPAPGIAIIQAQPEARAALAAVIEAFDRARQRGSQSCLILTSRYDFALPNAHGIDLAGLLEKVPLRAFDATEQGKQQRAARAEASDRAARSKPAAHQQALLGDIRRMALGNPLIQSTLTRLAFAEPTAAGHAIREMEAYVRRGEVKNITQLAEVFERLTFDAYRTALSPPEKAAFCATTLFEIPVPKRSLLAAIEAATPGTTEEIFARLMGLGLIELFEGQPPVEIEYISSKLARPLFGVLHEEQKFNLANAVLPTLITAWTLENGWLVPDNRALEAWRLAKIAESTRFQASAAMSGGMYLFLNMGDARAALELIGPAMEALSAAHIPPDLLLLRLGVECAERLGKVDLLDRYLEKVAIATGGEPNTRAILFGLKVNRLISQGQYDEALRIHREEELPVYERIGDVRSCAVTKGSIAEILFFQNQLDESLRILREEAVPALEQLGDVRARAAMMNQVADILSARGDFEEALRIRREEVVPGFIQAGDVRSCAVAMGRVADMLFLRGDLDEALRIRREEELAVYERLGDVRECAVTNSKIAEIYFRRGAGEVALRILRADVVPVLTRLSDVRMRAIAMSQIAGVLLATGEGEDAWNILQKDVVPVFEQLGDMRSRAIAIGRVADILIVRGDLDEALRLLDEEQLPAARQVGDLDGIASVLVKKARIHMARGVTGERALAQVRVDLSEAYRLAKKLHRLEIVCSAADELGGLLAAAGEAEPARALLAEALDGYRKLGLAQQAARIEARLATVSAAGPPAPLASPGPMVSKTAATSAIASPDGAPSKISNIINKLSAFLWRG